MSAPGGDTSGQSHRPSDPNLCDPSHPATGPATSTAGPHKHNLLNKMDPRVDSDLDGSRTSGSSQPSNSNLHTPSSSWSAPSFVGEDQRSPDPAPPSPEGTARGVSSLPDTAYGATPGAPDTKVDPRIDQPTAEGTQTPPDSEMTGATRVAPGPRSEKHVASRGAPPPSVSEKEVAPSMTASAPAGLHSAPTESHSLATADHEEKGTAQEDHDESEVKDLGWNQHVDQVPAPLVGGLPNEEVWTLVRRFNKQMYHVKATPTAPPGGLDLNIAEDEEFSPDKLRSNIERLYMTVIVGMAAFVKHIARLRSWNETRRTASFCTVYYLAWFFDIIGPVFLSTMLVLIVYPPSRKILFPPAPLALVDASTGGMKKPTAGMLGSHDSMTGAPEKHQGEAVEQEAHNFVTGLTSIGLSSATGKHPEDTAHKDGVVEDTVPDPTNLATGAANARESAKGGDPTTTHDKSKQPMEVAMWQKARPVMHILANIADTWERFANALSPTPPFPRDAARLRLGAILGSAIPVAFMTTSAVAVKATGFIMGAVFFGDPITSRGLKLLNEKVPHWERFLDIRNTLLLGVPTNAQLTVTLLRIGEANRAPLPPPPQSDAPPSSRPPSLHGDDVPMDVSHEEVQDAIHPEAPTPSSTSPTGSDKKGGKKVTAGTRILGFFKRTTRIGVTTTLGADRFKAAAGSGHARNRLGVLPKPNEDPFSGPVDFKARYQGKRGSIYLSTAGSDTPCLTFTREGESAPPPPSTTAATDATAADTKKAAPRIPLTSITSIKKLNGLGWKVKLVVGWAMTDREVADGIEIEDGQGNSWVFTAMQKRDELFNRLVAVGGQIWVSY